MQKEAKERIRECKEYKRRIKLLDSSYKKGLISLEDYNNSLKGRTSKAWLNYYDECIQYYKNFFASKNVHEKSVFSNKLIIPLIIILFSLGIFLLFKGESLITGYIVFNPYSNETLINDTQVDNNESLNITLPENITYNFTIPSNVTLENITLNGTIINESQIENITFNITLPSNYTLNETIINYTQFSNETSNETQVDKGGTLMFSTLAASNMPKKISLQGKLTNAAGNVLTGSYTFVFSIYDDYTSENKLWTENQSISVSRGIYDTTLGSVNALNLTFNDSYYLGIRVNYDPEMTPRINLSTTPYSFRSNTTDYVDCSNIFGGTDSDFCYDVGSAPDNYVNITGDTMTGNLDVNANVTITGNLTLEQIWPNTQDIIIELDGGSFIIRP